VGCRPVRQRRARAERVCDVTSLTGSRASTVAAVTVHTGYPACAIGSLEAGLPLFLLARTRSVAGSIAEDGILLALHRRAYAACAGLTRIQAVAAGDASDALVGRGVACLGSAGTVFVRRASDARAAGGAGRSCPPRAVAVSGAFCALIAQAKRAQRRTVLVGAARAGCVGGRYIGWHVRSGIRSSAAASGDSTTSTSATASSTAACAATAAAVARPAVAAGPAIRRRSVRRDLTVSDRTRPVARACFPTRAPGIALLSRHRSVASLDLYGPPKTTDKADQ
jgi:hypothetical protein